MTNPKSFAAIGGVDLRRHLGNCTFDTNTTPTAETSFYKTCARWKTYLVSESESHGNASYDTLQWIGHIGFFVAKQNSCHCVGKAMDLSMLQWNGTASRPCDGDHAAQRQITRRRYLAVDATLRKYFKWVLDGWYNSAHHDHIHASSHYATSNIVLSKSSTSDTVFVQAVCNNFNGAGLVIDGDWGPATDAAFDAINNAWDYDDSGCHPFTVHDDYVRWLHRVIIAGFSNVGASGVNLNDSCSVLGGPPDPP